MTSFARRRDLRPPLSDLEFRFVDELMLVPDPVAAGAKLGLSSTVSLAMFRKPTIRAAIAASQRARAVRSQVSQDFVLRRWQLLAKADPRELVEHWRVACRHCWGHEHRYQFDDLELAEAIAEYQRAYEYGRRGVSISGSSRANEAWLRGKNGQDLPPFDDAGGGGYTINAHPRRGPDWVAFTGLPAAYRNSDHSCPRCHGHGVQHVHFHDTRHLSEAGALLYLGTKVTGQGGIEIQMRNQAEAEKMLATHLGMFREREPVIDFDFERLDDRQLDAVLANRLISQVEEGRLPAPELAPPADEAEEAELVETEEP